MEAIANLNDHVVVCGGGAISHKATYFFQRAKQPIILVEQDEEKLRRTLLYLDPDYLQRKFGHYFDITQAVVASLLPARSAALVSGRESLAYQ